ncbi:YolD-like family protein [Virgibacillus byunsanensis]|uniref:YolD-like family protein n=1 Tax=Virgibacillus byunsanensis TaxID=570945 RepID=A0ABW3LKR7_9BACI
MSVNDRGTIKWTSMMLPEHVNLLREMWEEKSQKDKPILEEDIKEEINTQLQLAIHDNLTIEVKHFSGRDYLTKKGKLAKIDQTMLLFDDDTRINLYHVLDVYVD